MHKRELRRQSVECVQNLSAECGGFVVVHALQSALEDPQEPLQGVKLYLSEQSGYLPRVFV
ncbi:MAG: hypothetical protein QM221_01415 [Bacillota bacterium]|nr:hypothetical protein [Bacillota bacterium]